MKPIISYATVGFALLAGTATASAQTIITREVAAPPAAPVIVTQPPPPAIYSPEPLAAMPAGTFVTPSVQTVETVETVQTTQPARGVTTNRQVVRSRKSNKAVVSSSVGPTQRRTIYRTIVRENVAPAQTVITEPTTVEPGYTEIVQQPAYVPTSPVAPAPVVAGQIVAPAAPGMVAQPYRYVYEGDRILVVDPNTNIAISAIPR